MLKGVVRSFKRNAPDVVFVTGVAAPLFIPSGGGSSAFQALCEAAQGGDGNTILFRLKQIPSNAVRGYKDNIVYPVAGVVGSKVVKWALKGGR
jgi:hypothetical protein